jgi:predicted homoserine dehydrogenase-like protein
MTGRLQRRLAERERANAPVKVGLVGAGQMGLGLAAVLGRMPGMRLVAVADLVPGRAADAFRHAGVRREEIVETGTARAARAAVEGGRRVMTPVGALVSELPVDVVVDATGIPLQAALTAAQAIEARRHVVLLTVEADVTVGHLLAWRAAEAGVVYTGATGDEPAATKELVEFAEFLAFDVICAGKGKNNPLDRRATAQSLRAEGHARGVNPRMLAEFVDGTKSMVEMACLANATGLVPDVRGMHAAKATPAELTKVFIPIEDGGILKRRGVVDFAIGVAPGVFAVIQSDHPVIQEELRYLKMGDGPYYALYRPYHLTSVETPVSIARAALDHEASIAPLPIPKAEVITAAKRPLRRGERLGLAGEDTVYGLIEEADIARQEGLLPMGLAPNAEVLVDLAPDQPIRWEDVAPEETPLLAMRKEQDRLWRYPAEGRS